MKSSSTYFHHLAILLGLAVWTASVGCGTEPIPRIAVAGTTIVIPVPPVFPVGFGLQLSNAMSRSALSTTLPTVAYNPNSLAEDPQRGELILSLWDGPVSDVGSTSLGYLPIIHINRVQIDEGSPAANPAGNENADETLRARGHILAFVDIPADGTKLDVARDYFIKVEIYQRIPGDSGNGFVLLPQPQVTAGDWNGWGVPGSSGGEDGIPIRILPPEGENFHPLLGFTRMGSDYVHGYFDSDLPELTPRPKARIHYLNGNFYPLVVGQYLSAIEFDIQFPAERVEVLGVEIYSNRRSGAIAMLNVIAPGGTSCGSPSPGTASVQLIDPDRMTFAVEIVYRLINFDQTCGGQLQSGDLQVVPASTRAYDEDGDQYIGHPDAFVWSHSH